MPSDLELVDLVFDGVQGEECVDLGGEGEQD
jgi:hypothetical protein